MNENAYGDPTPKSEIPIMLIFTEEFDEFCGGDEIYMRTNKSGVPQNVGVFIVFFIKIEIEAKFRSNKECRETSKL